VKTIFGKEAPASAEEAKQGADTSVAVTLDWGEAEAWTERLLSALVNGVKGCNGTASFANAGLFALHTAWQTARQSR
jgi:hypothetical protein